MAERVVRVKLQAVVDDYNKAFTEAANKTRAVGTEAEKLAQTRQSLQTVGTAALGMGAALAAGVGVAIGKFAEFDQAMSFVAATGDDARQNMDALRQAALDAGAETVFSATESANAIEEMAKAGLSAKEILGGGLTGALDLAAAGGLEVADAAGIAATALKVFNLEGSDMSHVADLLAAGAGKAMGDVSDLSAALAQGGQVAAATGLSIEETTATLAAFASQGLLGSDAGTSFKTMLQRLTPQSNEAKEKMKELGISAYDASGNFIGMTEFAGNLQSALEDLTPEQRNAALSVMFGSDAVRAANVIYSEGEEGIRNWISAVDDQGYAAETAATRLDNLVGDWEAFTGALDTAFISMGEGANGPLRFFVQQLTGLVDGFNELPDFAKQLGLGIAAVASGVGLLGGAALLAIPKVNDLREALNGLGADGDAIVGKLGKLAAIGSGVVVGFAAAAAGMDLLTKAMQSMGDAAEVTDNRVRTAGSGAELLSAALGKGFGATQEIKTAEKAVEGLGRMLDLAAEGAQATGSEMKGVVSAAVAVEKLGAELGELASTDLLAAQKAFRMLVEDAGLTEAQMIQLIDKMPDFKKALTEQATAADEAADSQGLLKVALGQTPDALAAGSEAMAELQESTEEAEDALSQMVAALEAVARGALELGAAKDSALSALNSMTEAAAREGAALDGTNAASIQLRDSVRQVEEAHRASAQAILENGGTLDEAQGSWAAGRQAVLDMLVAKGMDINQARAWADQNLGSAQQVQGALANVKTAVDNIPGNKDVKVNAETTGAMTVLERFQQAVNGLRGKTVEVTTRMTTVNGQSVYDFNNNANGGYYEGRVKKFASGGFEPGIYPYVPGGIHKFAEEYAEGYISLDPARRDRSLAVYDRIGDALGVGGRQAAPVLSLEGLQISGSLDLGNGLVGFVQGIVSQESSARASSIRQRRRTDA